ncbi:carboxypeptidase-like regulatory domain-containing protein [Tunturiibacter gelidiferens]|uniref:Carboxypeptidase-like regulatory domain-containing protein n=1 Tax=Tunturiibacter gelidiferens TaxID=3069689 RepID=A0AAU7Z4H2_9BACT
MRARIALFSFFTFLVCSFAHGQDISAKITGTVTDASGAVIAGATVTARESSRGTVYPTKTNAAGVYYLSPLPVGQYVLKVAAPGFSSSEHQAISLDIAQTARIDVALTVGQASQTVEVSGAPPLLQTDDSYLGTVLDARANVTLPLATRNYNQLTLLSPGAVSLNPGSFTGSQASFQVGRPYINGNREQTNNYILDGMDNNQIDNNDVAFSPSVDAIQEFNLISQNAPSSYGNYLGGIINVTLKSGTNQFHGDVFEFIRNDALNANTWKNGLTKGQPYIPGTNNPDGTGLKPILRWNEFGGSVGGPIIKDKLFFFVDYQGSRFDQPATSVPYTVFTAAERQGNFASICSAGFNASGICNNLTQQLYNPYSSPTPGGRTPFLYNKINIPFSSAASKILNSNLYPAPINDLTTGNQVNVTHSFTNSDQGDLKIDWIASQKDHVYARYSQQHITNPTTNSQLLTGDSDNEFPLYNGVIDYTHTFNPSLLNNARIGTSYFPVTEGYTNPTGQNLPSTFGIAGAAPNQTFLPLQMFSGASYGPMFGNNNLVSQFHDTVVQAEDTVTIIRGKHTVNVGFEFYNYRTNVLYVGNSGLAGEFIYNGSFTSNPSVVIPPSGPGGASSTPTGWAEADFLLGLPQNVGLGSGGGRSLRNSLYSGFVQDDWHALPNLTLNLGLRYEVVTPRAEAHNQATNYGLFTGEVQIAGLNGNSKALYNQYNGPTNFQPRVGFSWQPGGDKSMVVRGAYGISNFTESTGTGNLLIQNPPFAIPLNVTYAGGTQALPTTTLDEGFSSFPASGCTEAAALAQSPLCFSGSGIHAFNPNEIRPAVSQQYNLTVQRQIGNSSTFSIGYVGQKTDHLMTIALINQKVLEADGTIAPSPYLNPTLQGLIGQARLTASTGYSNYNALQASFQQRLNHGLELQGNYTFSKCLGNSSGFYAQYGDTNAQLTQAGNNHFFFQNTYNPAADYGRCDQNVANSFNGFVTYDLPFGRGRTFGSNINRAADLVAGGWQVNSILQFHTGFPITAQASDNSGTTSGFPRANCTGQPIETPKKKSTIPGSPGYVWFDSSSVSQPTSGFGDCQVGSFTGPGLQAIDFSVSKTFHILESQSLQFRAEAINALNHPILVAPNSSIGTTFGLVNNAQGERNLQFALKYMF